MVDESGGVVVASDEEKESEGRPDPLKQLIRCFQRAATSEESKADSIYNDDL